MKLKLIPFPPPKQSVKEEEKEVYLTLRDVGFGGLTVVAVDSAGVPLPQGNLISFTPNGKTLVHGYIDPHLGFKLKPNQYLEVLEY